MRRSTNLPCSPGDKSGKLRGGMVSRGVLVVILSIVLFVIVFLVTGFAGLVLTGNFELAALIGGVCGFAAAWLTNAAYIVGRQRKGEDRGEGDEHKSDAEADRQAK